MHLTGDLKKFEKQNKLVDAVLSTLGSLFREFDRKQPIDHIFIPEDTMKVDNVLYDTKNIMALIQVIII